MFRRGWNKLKVLPTYSSCDTNQKTTTIRTARFGQATTRELVNSEGIGDASNLPEKAPRKIRNQQITSSIPAGSSRFNRKITRPQSVCPQSTLWAFVSARHQKLYFKATCSWRIVLALVIT